MSRLGSIIDDGGTTLASYQYMGADTMVAEDYNQPNVSLDYTADDYSGFDPFGRIAEQLWENMTSLNGPVPGEPVQRRGRDVCLGRLGPAGLGGRAQQPGRHDHLRLLL